MVVYGRIRHKLVYLSWRLSGNDGGMERHSRQAEDYRMKSKIQLGLATALVFWLIWLGVNGQLTTFLNLVKGQSND